MWIVILVLLFVALALFELFGDGPHPAARRRQQPYDDSPDDRTHPGGL